MATQSLTYFPIHEWVLKDDPTNEYVLFTRKEHEKAYLNRISHKNVSIFSFEEWETSNLVEMKAIELHRIKSFDKLLTVGESDIERAGQLREFLGIPGQQSFSSKIFRNKVEMKNFVSKNGFKTPIYNYINCYLDLIKFIDKYGFPVIIKPVDGGGSYNTHVISNKNDLYNCSIERSLNNMIVETFVDGEVYHMDGIILNNTLRFITPSKYINDCLSFKVGKSTASIIIDPNSVKGKLLIDYGKCLLNILPCSTNMTFHLEVFVDRLNKITFCEIACRTGGGRIAECINEEFGFHLTREYFRHECGLKSNLLEDNKFEFKKHRGWVLSSPLKGKLINIPEEIPFNWVFDFWRYAKIGNNFDGADNSVFSIAAFSCEAESEETLANRLNQVDSWFKESCVYEQNI